eukprot:CAMPEP_0170487030 /NCGR_PEP_ID=MMETSP0208-20121228/5898_1 /TAXON_ID=197538 /ORGANISM="Strombidium inclinatum, Strain S3" /LENGTH=150 /DNA_ID=CAMNT_0010761145 /DNA_START=697 /DNA_END=1146 /DNA_ORIENTATION=+
MVEVFDGLPHEVAVASAFAHVLQLFPVVLRLAKLGPGVFQQLGDALVVSLQLEQVKTLDRVAVLVLSLKLLDLGLSLLDFDFFVLEELLFDVHQVVVVLQLEVAVSYQAAALASALGPRRVVFENEVAIRVLLVEVVVSTSRVVDMVIIW